MEYQIKNLKIEDLPEIYKTSVEAFADYAVDMSYMTEENQYNRCLKNNTDFNHSVAVYIDNKMVGYTLIGIDNWLGEKSAFDVGTGIIKEHRGKGLARKMFDSAIPDLKNIGVKKFLLEVLQENEPAIKAYQKTGFRITRELDCFRINPASLSFKREMKIGLEIRKISRDDLMNVESFMDWQPSWENSLKAIQRIPNEIISYGAFVDGEIIGSLVYYPSLNWIMNLVVKKEFRRKSIAAEILNFFFTDYNPQKEYLKLLNVDHQDKAMITFLKNYGFEWIINQYEMEFVL